MLSAEKDWLKEVNRVGRSVSVELNVCTKQENIY